MTHDIEPTYDPDRYLRISRDCDRWGTTLNRLVAASDQTAHDLDEAIRWLEDNCKHDSTRLAIGTLRANASIVKAMRDSWRTHAGQLFALGSGMTDWDGR